MASSGRVENFLLKPWHVNVNNSRLLQLGLSSISDDERVWLLYPNVNRLDSSIPAGSCPQDPLNTRDISG